eukprot:TRINITY_DN7752_c0_g1_i1.p1 TRINITY_DN7752_c0_g1~~TRINITY_DN7752_c0_g1_i1.p1  ORF type:complete len:419 (-),score=68.03 TRINITY_DN7752_c0_g1_i1:206-1462(-)
MGNETSTARVDFKNLDESTVTAIRQTLKAGQLKELPASWNILPVEAKQKCSSQLKNPQGTIDESKYLGFAARHIGISAEDHVRFLCILIGKEPPVQIKDMKMALTQLFTALCNTYKCDGFSKETLLAHSEALSLSILHDSIYGTEKRKNTFRKEGDMNKELQNDELEKVVYENQLIEYAINQVLCSAYSIKSKIVPKSKIPASDSFLSPLQLLFLNHNIPHKYKDIWRPIFSTRKDGESFSKLAGLIINRGPTVLIVKDNEGNIFGGYNTQSWKIGPNFFGSSDSFLFHLEPVMNIYESTPFNQNYQYFNMKQKTMPNGLGQGGQLEYFGYWVDSEFGRVVTSPSCTTYFSPQLGAQEGKISDLEIWGVGEEPEDIDGGSASVLNMDPELQAVMEMMGKTFHSKAIREVDDKENEDED